MRIDLKQILKDKNPALLKKLPGFVISIASRILYLKKVNRALEDCEGLKGLDFVTTILNHLKIKRVVSGFSEVPEGDYIFAANHPLGGLDGMVLVEVISEKYPEARVLVNDILMNIEPMQELFLPINKHGKQSSTYAKMIAAHFESVKALISFPAGFCSRKIEGEVKDIAWNKNYILKALSYKRGIVPVFVDEINSPLFYRVERIRKFFKIKFNIGMILLPHELFRRAKKSKEVKLIFGTPITYEELSANPDVAYWNKEIRKKCYNLKN